MRTFCFVMVAALVAIPLSAQQPDRIWLEPMRPTSTESDWYPRAIQTRSGKLIDLDAKQIRFVVEGDEAETIMASSRVLWIEPGNAGNLQVEAIDLFIGRKYSDSLSKLPAMLKQRPPVWRQQWLTMLAATAAHRSGRGKIALELVGQLDRRPLPAITLARLPIQWDSGVVNSADIEVAKSRINDESPAVQLVAASWLLSSPDRPQAITTLKNLQSNSRKEISLLATVVSWRTATPPDVVSSHKSWREKIDRLPMVMQDGPIEMLIGKMQSAGLREQAEPLLWSQELTPISRIR